MGDNFLSAKMLTRDVLINIFAGIIGGTIVGVYSHIIWLGFLSSALILAIIFLLWLRKKYGRIIKLIHSTHARYYYSFDLEENSRVWQEARNSFCYIGISSDSILELFRRWIEETHLSSYRILLMKPRSKALMTQEAFQKGHGLEVKLEDLSREAREAVEAAAEATSKRIIGAISFFKTTALCNEGRLQVRLYDEFSPWWMYLFDDQKAYIGILEKGKRGSNSPVVVMEKNEAYVSPFDAFKNHFERIWSSAQDA